jgi:hypothetical protein
MDLCGSFPDDSPQHGSLVGDLAPVMEARCKMIKGGEFGWLTIDLERL